MTCYIPCHGSNLFKIKSICSFHTLCSTSSLQSTADYSMTLKTGCIYNKLITYSGVNCIKIFWKTTNIHYLSTNLPTHLSSICISKTNCLVWHHDMEKTLEVSFFRHTVFRWGVRGGGRFLTLHKAFLSLPTFSAKAPLPPRCGTSQKTSWLS